MLANTQESPGRLDSHQQGNKSKDKYRYLIFISMCYITLMLIGALMVNRILDFNNIYEPGGILIFPLTYFLGDIITEVYGYQTSRHILWCALFCQFIFAIGIKLTMLFPAAPFLHDPESYQNVLSHLLVYSLTFSLGTIAGGFTNIYIVSKFKVVLNGRFFWLRCLGATCVGEGIFTVITLGPVLLATNPLDKVLTILLSAYLFKVIYGLVFILPSSLCAAFLKKSEKINIYDTNISYNPFIVKMNQ